MEKGKFIVFEGIDGAGKSTLSKMLAAKLSQVGIPTHETFEPTNSPIGSLIRNILGRRIIADEQTIAALFLADRLDHIKNEVNGMLKQLDKARTVICDRYYLSSYAYHVPHVSLDWVIEANTICKSWMKPDVIFFIDIPVEVSLRRLLQHRQSLDLFETKERITQVYENYHKAIENVRDQENIIIIDGTLPIERVSELIWSHVEAFYSSEFHQK